MTMTLLKADGFGISIDGKPVLEGVGFQLEKGQRLGIIGETGGGKSLLALAIAGLLPERATTTGTLTLDDAPLPVAEAERAKLRGPRIGVLPQHAGDGLDPLQTIGEQLGTAAADAALGEVGLNPTHAARYPRGLSVAERQLAALAITLVGKPQLLIADEPVAGLDALATRQIVGIIERLCIEREMALVLVSHDLKLIALLATKVLVLNSGHAIEAGDKAEVFGHPKHAHTRMLMTAGRHRARTLMRTPIGGQLLDVRNVSRSFPQRGNSLFERQPPLLAVDKATLSIRQAESLALIGPAGSGKSTLARIIAGLEDATSGELEIDHAVYHGTDLPRPLRREISFVFRDPRTSFNPRLTVGESIAEPLQLEAQRLMDELSARIVEVTDAIGVSPDILGAYPAAFTTAQLQRLAFARALVTRPRLIVLDEPVAALDVTARGEFVVMLNRLRADFGLTFLVVSHDLEMVRIVADRVLVMDKGKIIETGTPATLLDKPQQELTKQLVAAALPDVGIVPVF
jgi:peptide/nickel transport system ATP-binding protein